MSKSQVESIISIGPIVFQLPKSLICSNDEQVLQQSLAKPAFMKLQLVFETQITISRAG